MTNGAVGEPVRESLHRDYSIAIKRIFSFVAAPQNLNNNGASTLQVCKWKWQFHGNQTLQGRNPQFERGHSPDLQAGLPEETTPTLRELDGKLISLLHSIRSRGGVLNFSVVKASALSLVNSNSSANLSGFEATAPWVRSIYKRCNFSRRAGTTTRPPVPRGIYEECKLTYLTDINRAITQHNIPPELVINADQTPCSYVSVRRMTMATCNSSAVPIKGLTDKRNITLTFVISLSGSFLPMQIIYQGKTDASQPRGFKLPNGFAISQNPYQYLNEQETLFLIDEIIKPYVETTRKELKPQPTQKALLIWGVFKGKRPTKFCRSWQPWIPRLCQYLPVWHIFSSPWI